MARTPLLTATGLLTAALVIGPAAWAQSNQSTPTDRDRQPRTETEGQAPPNSGNLSDRLDRSQGVIKPPQGVDPGMHAPAPDPGSQRTPVIPPPGTPGGDQTVEPK
jgi:hypothetical protein